MHLSSICVKEAIDLKSTKPHVLPIYATSSFVFDKIEDGIDIFTNKEAGHVYSRYGNPTIDTVSQKIADLEAFDIDEDVFGLMTSSGMSAIAILINSILNSGQNILTQGNIYGGTTELFKKIFSKQNINTTFIDLSNYDLVEKTIKQDPSLKLIYIETPSNPTLDCVDLEKIAMIGKKYGVTTVVDNTFCTPLIQRPFNYGIDFIIHSTTKYLNGHGNSIAGIIIGKGNIEEKNKIWTTLKLYGATCNSWDAWLTYNGLKTLALRMNAHSENSTMLAKYLSNQDKIGKINHLSLNTHPHHNVAKMQMSNWGGMISFEVGKDINDAKKFTDALKFCTQAPTLGDVDTLILHPATSSHLNVDKNLRNVNGITDNLLRVSVGIENINDIIEDIDMALSTL